MPSSILMINPVRRTGPGWESLIYFLWPSAGCPPAGPGHLSSGGQGKPGRANRCLTHARQDCPG